MIAPEFWHRVLKSQFILVYALENFTCMFSLRQRIGFVIILAVLPRRGGGMAHYLGKTIKKVLISPLGNEHQALLSRKPIQSGAKEVSCCKRNTDFILVLVFILYCIIFHTNSWNLCSTLCLCNSLTVVETIVIWRAGQPPFLQFSKLCCCIWLAIYSDHCNIYTFGGNAFKSSDFCSILTKSWIQPLWVGVKDGRWHQHFLCTLFCKYRPC